MIAFNEYCLGIDLRAAIMTQGGIPRAIMAARRSIPRPYHCKQPIQLIKLIADCS